MRDMTHFLANFLQLLTGFLQGVGPVSGFDFIVKHCNYLDYFELRLKNMSSLYYMACFLLIEVNIICIQHRQVQLLNYF